MLPRNRSPRSATAASGSPQLRRIPIHLVQSFVPLLLTLAARESPCDGGWLPVSPSEHGLAAPLVEEGADAEALFWDVRVEDRNQDGQLETELHHYLRIKVFTPRGKETQ